MLAQNYYRYKQYFDQGGVIFSFSGFISEEILFALGDALRKKLSLEDTDANTIKRVFSVFVEQVQNIIRYSIERVDCANKDAPAAMSSGIIIVGFEDGQFYVGCGNTVYSDDVAGLRENLEILRKLDKDELRAFYREKLKEEADGSRQGANLGLIEIARRSSVPIEFEFLNIDANKVFFCIKSYI